MKIVCVAPTFPTHLKFWRGTFVENFCSALAKTGSDVSVIVPDGYNNIVAERILLGLNLRNARKSKVPWSYAPFLSPSRLTARFEGAARYLRFAQERAVYKALSEISEPPDLVYAHFLGSAVAAHRWCATNQVPLVVVSGESSYEPFCSAAKRGERHEAIRSLPHVFFVSEKNRSAYMRFFGSLPERSSILPNAVDTAHFRPQPKGELRERLGLPGGAKIVAFLGYFIERKGPLRVLKALEMQKDVYGVFIGTGPQRPTGTRVLFAGTMENEQVADWLAACDVFALPSLNEGRSNAILEALACGLPVVVSDRSFNREFLNEECAVFVDPEDSESISHGIRACLSPGRTAEMSAAARALAAGNSLEARAERFLEVVNGFVKRSPCNCLNSMESRAPE